MYPREGKFETVFTACYPMSDKYAERHAYSSADDERKSALSTQHLITYKPFTELLSHHSQRSQTTERTMDTCAVEAERLLTSASSDYCT